MLKHEEIRVGKVLKYEGKEGACNARRKKISKRKEKAGERKKG